MKRFHGVGGTDYEICTPYFPGNDECETLVARTIAEHIGHDRGRVLDLGVGTGLTSRAILRRCPNAGITALDNEAVMIKQARKSLREWQSQVKFVTQDALEFLKNCPDQSFDAIASAMVIHNFTQVYRREALKQLARVLKTGGVFVNGDKYAKDDVDARRRAYEWQVRHFEHMRRETRRDDLADYWINHITLDETAALVMPEAEARRQMQQIGFKNIRRIFRRMQYAVVTATR